MNVRMYVCMFVCTYVRTYVCTYVCMYVSVCTRHFRIHLGPSLFSEQPLYFPDMGDSHRCSVILTEEQYQQMLAEDTVIKKDWFGNGKSIPVKGSIHDAETSFMKAGITEKPCMLVTFQMPLTTFHDWVDNDLMVRTKHVGGYRIKQNINVKDIDPYYKAHPVAPYCL